VVVGFGAGVVDEALGVGEAVVVGAELVGVGADAAVVAAALAEGTGEVLVDVVAAPVWPASVAVVFDVPLHPADTSATVATAAKTAEFFFMTIPNSPP
jgi:hypothetical protein